MEPILQSEEVYFKNSRFVSGRIARIALNKDFTLFVQIDESSQDEYCLSLENDKSGVIVTWNKLKLQSMRNAIAHAKQLAGFYTEQKLFSKVDALFSAQENVAIEELRKTREDEAKQEDSFEAFESLLIEYSNDSLAKENKNEPDLCQENVDKIPSIQIPVSQFDQENSKQVAKQSEAATQAFSPTTSASKVETVQRQLIDSSFNRSKLIQSASILTKVGFAIATLTGITYFVVRSILPSNVPSPDEKEPVIKKMETD
ncbi:MAG: hypothetical protein ACFCUV_07075 [Rivularia sp. (in: cyanobacteria)]